QAPASGAAPDRPVRAGRDRAGPGRRRVRRPAARAPAAPGLARPRRRGAAGGGLHGSAEGGGVPGAGAAGEELPEPVGRALAARRGDGVRRAALDRGAHRTDSGAARTRLLGQAVMSAKYSERPAQVPSDTRFIFVTGGVVSSLGKGIAAASIGRLLVSRGLTVGLQKFDPYINVDPGTMSPYQHGEVFVTEDGAETDLDLGNYERFSDANATRAS